MDWHKNKDHRQIMRMLGKISSDLEGNIKEMKKVIADVIRTKSLILHQMLAFQRTQKTPFLNKSKNIWDIVPTFFRGLFKNDS